MSKKIRTLLSLVALISSGISLYIGLISYDTFYIVLMLYFVGDDIASAITSKQSP